MQFHEVETKIAPPPGFRGANDVVSVRLLPHQLPPVLSGARRDGVRYEAKFHSYARARWGGLYRTFQSHAFRFRCADETESRLAVPDGVLELSSRLVLFECKLRHCSISYFQLTELYAPLLMAYKYKPVTCIEVCKHYDPQTVYPKHGIVTPSDLDEWNGPEEVGVCLWKP
jgi:hypothetical protein